MVQKELKSFVHLCSTFSALTKDNKQKVLEIAKAIMDFQKIFTYTEVITDKNVNKPVGHLE